jgi:hypothetical protein
VWKTMPQKKAGAKIEKKRVVGYVLDVHFPYRDSLRTMLMQDEALRPEMVAKSIKPLAKWSLVILTGIFTEDFNSDVDVLLVGKDIQKAKLDTQMLALQAEVGVDLRYAVLSPDEYEYRYQMFDKFVRDVLSSKHIRIIDTQTRVR